ncbi:MAG: hypothetical protein ACNA78_08480 [Balneolaceae bacterium]
MKIDSRFITDTVTPGKPSGGYEWWYFDALSADGVYSLVIIFYEGNPFSKAYIRDQQLARPAGPEAFPAISISVYKHGDPIFYSFEEVEPTRAGFETECPAGFVGENHFRGEETAGGYRYVLNLNQHVATGDRIEAELHFNSGRAHLDPVSAGSADELDHSWNLVQPKAGVTGEIRISGLDHHSITFTGNGYHDHNSGGEPMKESFREWYWGRAHLPDSTVIYYLMNKQGVWDSRVFEVRDDEQTIRPYSCSVQRMEPITNLFGLASASRLSIRCEDIQIDTTIRQILDDGPFYQRSLQQVEVEKGRSRRMCTGIGEYIYPSRIYFKRFWPLVDMRIQYPGKPHWVQRFPRLYRWTW